MDEYGVGEFGREWDALIEALHAHPKVVVRANTLHCTRDELWARLRRLDVNISSSPLSPDALVFSEHINVFSCEEFREGLFEVQDSGSQCIAPFCQAEPGMRVIDACAGSGGKTLHLAALMHNKGRIISLDTESWKLKELAKRLNRAGVSIVETRHIQSTKTIKRLHDSAHRVLLDVPCSGLGVLRRNPDTKWHLQADDIARFVSMQRDILTQYAAMVRQGAKLVYATCSIVAAECEDQARWFCQNNTGWELEEERRLLPHHDDSDGFYMARFRRSA